MGIEKFFNTINRNFNIATDINNQKIDATHLYIDFNSIIHNASSSIISEINSKKEKEYDKDYTIDDIETIIINKVNDNLKEIFNLFTNLKLVYFAIDGVPSFGKMIEQKKRRYIGDFIEQILSKYSIKINWSKQNISPGTIFMKKMEQFLEKNYIPNKNINYILSSSNERGEGEMKIIHQLNKLKTKDNIVFYSPDSDVILLSMINKNANNLFVLRWTTDTKIYNLVNIKNLIDVIYLYVEDRLIYTNIDIDKVKLIRDIAYIFTVFGNDFIPRTEPIQTNQDFILLIDIYLINYIKTGYLLEKDNDIVYINNNNFKNFLILLGKQEYRLLWRNSYQNIFYNYNYANQKNFYIDLLNIESFNYKNNTIFSKPFFNFKNNLLFYINPGTLIDEINDKRNEIMINKNKNDKYLGLLEWYDLDINTMIEIIMNKDKKTILNTNFIDIENIYKNTKYDTLRRTEYNSTIKKHVMALNQLEPRDSEIYLINNKLDQYYTMFNPISDFNQSIINKKKIDYDFYTELYFKKINIKSIVNDYLLGFKWIVDYYINNSIDEYWYYPYYKSPLLKQIINYYDTINKNIWKIKPKQIDIDLKPIEQLLYITPITKENLNILNIFNITQENKNKLILFINNHPYYWLNLDDIYVGLKNNSLKKHLFDCSTSVFISKCHYHILDFPINIKDFVNKMRKVIKL